MNTANNIKKISIDEWKNAIHSFAPNNVFQTCEWFDLVASEFNLRCVYYKLTLRGESTFIGFHIANNGDAFAPFIGYGGFLNEKNFDTSTIRTFLKTLEQTERIKIRRMKFFPGINLNFTDSHTWNTDNTEILEIQGNWRTKVHKNTRNAINNTQRKGFIFDQLRPADFDQFYSIYSNTMQRVQSLYTTPHSLFQKLYRGTYAYFEAAYMDNELHAVNVYLLQNAYSFNWWNASTTFGRKNNANYLVHSSAIDLLYKKGVRYLDMASSHTKGIRDFKRKWGTKEYSYTTYNN